MRLKNLLLKLTANDFIHAGDIVFRRDLDVRDAVNVAVAERLNLVIVSEDKDYDRVKDIVKVIRP
ncbi:PIN domain-containing protein [Stygiolobus caldivivus]|uniref:PIN domain-containing protein n=1 Tax=Stygiolobus caldivivus TaxID=2824673 RepID=A0A8D5ZH40_9CREN|nr:PIN domain-containing protein [Stygiolobus caldivivus]BCU71503.1 hypothetical protein KN1_28000 [Stygiolobus caldivivus]